MKRHQRGEIATIITIGALIILGIISLASSVFLKKESTKISTKSKASEISVCVQGLSNITTTVEASEGVINTTSFTCHVEADTDKEVLCAVSINNGWPVNCSWIPSDQEYSSGRWKLGFSCNLNDLKVGDKLNIRAAKAVSNCISYAWLSPSDYVAGPTYYFQNRSKQDTTVTCTPPGKLSADGKRCDPACCTVNTDCPSDQKCWIANGGCRSNTSCGILPTQAPAVPLTSLPGSTSTPTPTKTSNLNYQQECVSHQDASKRVFEYFKIGNDYYSCDNYEKSLNKVDLTNTPMPTIVRTPLTRIPTTSAAAPSGKLHQSTTQVIASPVPVVVQNGCGVLTWSCPTYSYCDNGQCIRCGGEGERYCGGWGPIRKSCNYGKDGKDRKRIIDDRCLGCGKLNQIECDYWLADPCDQGLAVDPNTKKCAEFKNVWDSKASWQGLKPVQTLKCLNTDNCEQFKQKNKIDKLDCTKDCVLQ